METMNDHEPGPADDELCELCGESIVEGEDVYTYHAEAGGFTHDRCADTYAAKSDVIANLIESHGYDQDRAIAAVNQWVLTSPMGYEGDFVSEVRENLSTQVAEAIADHGY